MRQRKLSLGEIRGILKRIPFDGLLGMRIPRVHRDGITIECSVSPRLRNLAGALHGGVTPALADAAVGLALHRHMGGRRILTTVELKINYFRPVKEGRVFARSHLLRVGSTLCVARVDITDDKAKAVGTALITYMLLGARETAAH